MVSAGLEGVRASGAGFAWIAPLPKANESYCPPCQAVTVCWRSPSVLLSPAPVPRRVRATHTRYAHVGPGPPACGMQAADQKDAELTAFCEKVRASYMCACVYAAWIVAGPGATIMVMMIMAGGAGGGACGIRFASAWDAAGEARQVTFIFRWHAQPRANACSRVFPCCGTRAGHQCRVAPPTGPLLHTDGGHVMIMMTQS